ncbi:MAG: GatB/YqeY domain-containing protein [Anaerolineae bacterium]|nr:GatB/YqeY domain-containing protein [Anaerolineae bacterium]
MSIQERLMADLKDAMRAQDEAAKLTIRMAMAALKNARVDKNADLTEAEEIAVLQKQVRQCEDAIVDYQKGNREDLVAQTRTEIEILNHYLPQMMSREAIAEIAHEVIAQVGANSSRQMGQVMRELMPRVQGRADGRLVSDIVRELLAGG